MFQIASFKIICTDSTEILFSQIQLKFFFKTRVCWFELSLAKQSFFTDPYCAGVSNKHCLMTFFVLSMGISIRMKRVKLFQKVNEFVIKRFYLTLMLYELWKQKTIWEVAEKFQQPRGFIQNLLSSAASFASCVAHFCQVYIHI